MVTTQGWASVHSSALTGSPGLQVAVNPPQGTHSTLIIQPECVLLLRCELYLTCGNCVSNTSCGWAYTFGGPGFCAPLSGGNLSHPLSQCCTSSRCSSHGACLTGQALTAGPPQGLKLVRGGQGGVDGQGGSCVCLSPFGGVLCELEFPSQETLYALGLGCFLVLGALLRTVDVLLKQKKAKKCYLLASLPSALGSSMTHMMYTYWVRVACLMYAYCLRLASQPLVCSQLHRCAIHLRPCVRMCRLGRCCRDQTMRACTSCTQL